MAVLIYPFIMYAAACRSRERTPQTHCRCGDKAPAPPKPSEECPAGWAEEFSSAIGGGYLAGAYSWGTLALLAACAGRLELSELSFQLGIGLLTGIALPFLLLGLALPPGSEHGGRFFPAAAALAGPGIVTLSLGRGAGVAFLLGAVLAGFPLAGVLSGMEGEGEAAGQQLLLLLEIGGAAGLFWSTFPYL